MSLLQKTWFRVLSYVGIFFLSWASEILYMLVIGNGIIYNLYLFTLGAFVPLIVSLLLTFRLMRRGYLVGPFINFFRSDVKFYGTLFGPNLKDFSWTFYLNPHPSSPFPIYLEVSISRHQTYTHLL